MKLAEALSERADIKKRIEQLETRLILNAKVQDGEKPSEDPKELITELDHLTKRFEELVTKINLRNATVVDSSETLTNSVATSNAQNEATQKAKDLQDQVCEKKNNEPTSNDSIQKFWSHAGNINTYAKQNIRRYKILCKRVCRGY